MNTIRIKIVALLSIIAMVTTGVGIYLFSTLLVAQGDAALINFMGRQRMLAQAMAKDILASSSANDSEILLERQIFILDGFITNVREVYSDSVIANLPEDIQLSSDGHSSIPFPATFIKLVNERGNSKDRSNIELIAEKPINPSSGLKTQMDRNAWEFFLKSSNLESNKPFRTLEERGNGLYLIFYTPDIATVPSCVSCHIEYKRTDTRMGDLLGIRKYSVLYSDDIASGYERLDSEITEYEKTSEIFRDTLKALTFGGLIPKNLKRTEFQLIAAIEDGPSRKLLLLAEEKLNNVTKAASVLISNSASNKTQENVSKFMTASNELLGVSDDIVVRYTEVATKTQSYLRLTVIVSGLLILLVVFCVYAYTSEFVIARIEYLSKTMRNLAKSNTEMNIAFTQDTDEVGTMAAALNDFVKERMATEKSIRAAHERALIANRTKSDFLANMSHELRTPLNTIIGYTQMLKERIFGPVGSEKNAEYIDDVNFAGNHLLNIIQDILDLSKVEAGEMQLHESRIDLSSLVEACIRIVREKAHKKDIDLLSDIQPTKLALYADETRLKQVVINLLSNALKFTPDNGEVKVSAWLDGNGAIVIEVSDTGIGVSPEDISKIIKPFEQVENAFTRHYQGTGLGLSIVKSLSELHGAELEFKSELGSGSQVSLRFPAERSLFS
ncbi:MAG: hypothetical protein HON65_06040 [Rhodospirillales bacterium]|nr:hypothetical protein [Rhodospirillales bacterium]